MTKIEAKTGSTKIQVKGRKVNAANLIFAYSVHFGTPGFMYAFFLYKSANLSNCISSTGFW